MKIFLHRGNKEKWFASIPYSTLCCHSVVKEKGNICTFSRAEDTHFQRFPVGYTLENHGKVRGENKIFFFLMEGTQT
jgi:hypothetical protein